ncbi:AraC family transcriptional regulator [Lutimonas vermicola]|uniref:AraC family transcriptional regulator n=1 Tax=Lutimonas vermicola TaxID=414288 RepID=A0ABU9L398_9FLAO
MESVINTIVWAAIIQGLLLGLLYIFSKRHRSRANKLLGFFLLCFVLEALTMWLPFDYLGSYSVSQYFDLPEVKLLFPVLFLNYVLEKLGAVKNYRTFLKFHYILVFAVMLLTLPNLILFAVSGESLRDYFSWDTISNVFLANQYYAFFLTIVALVISIKEVLRYQNKIRNAYSDLDMLEIKWLWQFIFALVPITFMWGLELTRIAFGGSGMSVFVLLTWAFIIVFIYFVSFIAFHRKNLFEGVPELVMNDEEATEQKNDHSGRDFKAMSIELQHAMESKNYYLNHDLTIYDLSKEMNIPPRLLSTCINQEIGVNFNEWVNNYRVEKALDLLQDPSKIHYSIEGIGEDAGFKSRSAMYTAFKKKTGYSPGHFRKQ